MESPPMVGALAVPVPAFWNDRRVLITGHTGFKGSWLSLWLQSMGARVSGFALPPQSPALYEMARVGDGMASRFGDVRDPDVLDAALADGQPEVVFHLAARALVRQSYAEPVESFAVNMLGTVHLLESVRRTSSVQAVVVCTSDKCYENRETERPYREDDSLGGHDPYSASKGCAEIVTASYRRSFFGSGGHPAAVASVRAGNVIGGGDWAVDRLVPDAVRAFRAGQPLVIRTPSAVRPWQHVLEPLAGYLCLAQRLSREDGQRFAQAWNFGPDDADERPVGTVATTLAALWRDGAAWQRDGADNHPHEAGLLKLDSGKARERLGWRPRWSLDKALAATISWYKAQAAGADMRAATLAQIAAYMAAGED